MFAFRKILITLALLSYTEFFGLINTDEDIRIPGGLKIYDIFMIFLIVDFIYLSFNSKVFKGSLFSRNMLDKFVTGYLLLVLLVGFSMPFRAPIEFMESFKMTRIFFPLLLYYSITYDLTVTRSFAFYESLWSFIAVVFSLIFITTSVMPEFVQNNFRGLHIKMETSFGFKIPRTYAQGFLFPYVYFVYQYVKYFITKKINVPVFFITFMGITLQGFRSYFLGVLVLIFLINVLFANRERIINSLIGLTIIGGIFFISSFFVGNEFFENKVMSIFSEVSNDEGTYAAREVSDEAFRLPLLLNNLSFGIGFVHGESRYAASLGAVYEDRDYTLYTTDSGLITMSLMFGVVGNIVIFALSISLVYYIYKQIKKRKHDSRLQLYGITAFSFMTLLLLTIKTHGGLISIYGLLPLTYTISLLKGYITVQQEAQKQYVLTQ